MQAMLRQSAPELRHRIYEILHHGTIGDQTSRVTGQAIVVLIIVNLIAVTLQSVPDLAERYGPLFTAVELLSLTVFTLEYGLRVWVAVEHPPYHHLGPHQARLKFIFSAMGIIDLLAVLPFWLALVLPAELRVVLVFRVIRFLKLTRYSAGVSSLLDVIYTERRALFGCFIILMGATLIAASVMHLIERNVQPDKFGTIPDAMWWAIVTLGTLGYGDVVPVTALGRVVAGVTIFLGLIMVALPVGIVATAFAERIHRRDFVVTLGMVARVPLFAGLNAADIADIMRLLRAQQIEAGEVIARRGEAAHSMYFIAAGEVEIELRDQRVRLGAGHFFGEVAALRRARRSATATAVTRTSLLALDAHDLHALMDRDPRVAKRIQDVVRDRLGRDIISPHGDVVSEELEETPMRERPANDPGQP
ncbi:MAG TPA: cyclic nucleotide-gated ion channel [Xanthobacteraceae bacterium]|jgi:voltage-gated potassium channel